MFRRSPLALLFLVFLLLPTALVLASAISGRASLREAAFYSSIPLLLLFAAAIISQLFARSGEQQRTERLISVLELLAEDEDAAAYWRDADGARVRASYGEQGWVLESSDGSRAADREEVLRAMTEAKGALTLERKDLGIEQ